MVKTFKIGPDHRVSPIGLETINSSWVWEYYGQLLEFDEIVNKNKKFCWVCFLRGDKKIRYKNDLYFCKSVEFKSESLVYID